MAYAVDNLNAMALSRSRLCNTMADKVSPEQQFRRIFSFLEMMCQLANVDVGVPRQCGLLRVYAYSPQQCPHRAVATGHQHRTSKGQYNTPKFRV
jgi:hypothetical protein